MFFQGKGITLRNSWHVVKSESSASYRNKPQVCEDGRQVGRAYAPLLYLPELLFPDFPVLLIFFYSQRNATSGSTLVARQAGIRQASRATRVSNRAIAVKVNGSVALTP